MSGQRLRQNAKLKSRNLQECAVLQNLLDQLVQVHGVNKVAQADAMIKRAVDQQPDAGDVTINNYHESNDGGEGIGGSNSAFASDDGDFV
jgi:mannitol-specific phosphotransferase system IIBC component